ncbi:hypothetical protein HDV00_012596 [Rhizophlyctis rosea]|nr:hypothetical protein HDV00_012596 [Rhizophlyctis rosea]
MMHVKFLLVATVAALVAADSSSSSGPGGYSKCTTNSDCDSSSLCTTLNDNSNPNSATKSARCVPSCLVSSCVSQLLNKSATTDSYVSCNTQYDCAQGTVCSSVKADDNTAILTMKCIPNCMIPSCYVQGSAARASS